MTKFTLANTFTVVKFNPDENGIQIHTRTVHDLSMDIKARQIIAAKFIPMYEINKYGWDALAIRVLTPYVLGVFSETIKEENRAALHPTEEESDATPTGERMRHLFNVILKYYGETERLAAAAQDSYNNYKKSSK